MSESKGSSKSTSSSNPVAWAILTVLALFIAFLIPVTLAIVIFLFSRKFLSKKEGYFLAGASLLAISFNFAENLGSIFRWSWVLLTGGDRLDIPYLPVILFTFLFLGIILAINDSKIAKIGTTRIARYREKTKRRVDQNLGKGAMHRESILPTELEISNAIKIVAPGGLTIDPSSHSYTSSAPGNRDFPIGIDKSGNRLMLNESELAMHALVFGSTGSGKSKTLESLAGSLLDLGWEGMIVDLKEDTKPGGLRDWCYQYATHHAVPYQELRLSDPNPAWWFNPLDGMGADEMRDTILSLNEFEAAYWEAINKKMLGQVINLFMDAHAIDPITFPAPTMLDIGRLLASPSLPAASKKMVATVVSAANGLTKETYNTIQQPTKDESMSAAGLGAKLTLIYDTVVGRTVLQPAPGKLRLDVTQPGLTYIGLDSQGKPDLTRIVSSAVLQRMSVYSSQRTTGTSDREVKRRFLIVDEANWVDRQIVQNLLSRARSAGIAMVLCTQGPMDWIDPKGGNAFATLSQNTNVCIVMSQGEPKSAELLAEYIGKQKTLNTMQKMVDDKLVDSGSAREALDYIIQPDELRRLSIGQAILRVGKPKERICWVQIKIRDPKMIPGQK